MSTKRNICYLTQTQIDKQKWDQCIDRAGNGLVYAFSFFLDHMADHWDAMVMNDYEMVMPLPWRKKMGIYYLYQPFLTAQAGVFGNDIDAAQVDDFLKAVPRKFRYWDFNLNHANIYALQSFELHLRANYVLKLDKTYDDLYHHYRENIKRNIKKATRFGCTVARDIPAEEIIAMAIQQMSNHSKPDAAAFERFKKLYHLLQGKKMAVSYGIFSAQKELLASCIFLLSHNRAYYLLVGNHPNGKTLGASHMLIDAFIKDHAGTNTMLDFEGSDIPKLAFFYSSFGAQEEKYAAIRLNRLPFYLKWLKK